MIEVENKETNSKKVELLEMMTNTSHEQIVFCQDNETGLKAIIAIHDTTLGPFFYYVKKPAGGEKAKVKLSAKKYNPSTRKHEMFVEKKLPPHSK